MLLVIGGSGKAYRLHELNKSFLLRSDKRLIPRHFEEPCRRVVREDGSKNSRPSFLTAYRFITGEVDEEGGPPENIQLH